MIQANLLFCVKHAYTESAYCGAKHSHPCYELVYYCEGSGLVDFNNTTHRFEKDTFMICAPDVDHVERGERGTTVLYIGFELADDTKLSQGVFKNSDYGILEYMEKIYHETKHWSPHSYELMHHYVAIIVLKLLNSQEVDKELLVGRSLDNIARYIGANYKDNLNTRALASLAGYSYDHFRKLFFKKFGVTVNDFILKKRIEVASEMLREQKYLIKEIATDCGFSSVAQFCTKYREIKGISPKQMQKNMLENEQTIEKDKYSGEK